MNPKPAQLLETSTVCPANVTEFISDSWINTSMHSTSTILSNYSMLPTAIPSTGAIPEREGLIKLYHIAYLLVPIFGCIISLVLGITCSLLSGGYKTRNSVRPEYLSRHAWTIWPASVLPTKHPYKAPSMVGDNSADTPNGMIGASLVSKNDKNDDNNNMAIYLQSNGKFRNYSKNNDETTDKSIILMEQRSTKDNNENQRSQRPKIVKQNAIEFDDYSK